MDLDEAVLLLRPQTAVNLRKLAIWVAGQAEQTTHASARESGARVALKLAEEAEWLEFQVGCETTAAAVVAVRVP